MRNPPVACRVRIGSNYRRQTPGGRRSGENASGCAGAGAGGARRRAPFLPSHCVTGSDGADPAQGRLRLRRYVSALPAVAGGARESARRPFGARGRSHGRSGYALAAPRFRGDRRRGADGRRRAVRPAGLARRRIAARRRHAAFLRVSLPYRSWSRARPCRPRGGAARRPLSGARLHLRQSHRVQRSRARAAIGRGPAPAGARARARAATAARAGTGAPGPACLR